MTGVRFIVKREGDGETARRWAYIDSCPHGVDLGAICLGPAASDERTKEDPHWDKITWQWTDLGNGRCRINPSILSKGVHGGQDCHFGPGEFPFIWLEPGELRNVEPFLSRYNAWVGKL